MPIIKKFVCERKERGCVSRKSFAREKESVYVSEREREGERDVNGTTA